MQIYIDIYIHIIIFNKFFKKVWISVIIRDFKNKILKLLNGQHFVLIILYPN